MSNDLKTGRTTPPKDEEWPTIWATLKRLQDRVTALEDRVQIIWKFIGPPWAFISNWKAILAAGSVFAYLRGDAILEVIKAALGVSE